MGRISTSCEPQANELLEPTTCTALRACASLEVRGQPRGKCWPVVGNTVCTSAVNNNYHLRPSDDPSPARRNFRVLAGLPALQWARTGPLAVLQKLMGQKERSMNPPVQGSSMAPAHTEAQLSAPFTRPFHCHTMRPACSLRRRIETDRSHDFIIVMLRNHFCVAPNFMMGLRSSLQAPSLASLGSGVMTHIDQYHQSVAGSSSCSSSMTRAAASAGGRWH